MSNVILNQDINRYSTSSNQSLDDLMKTLQEIRLNDSFSVSLGLDDSNIEVVAEELIDLDVLHATCDDYANNVSIVNSVLEQHHLLHNDSTSNEDDFGKIPPLVTVE